MGTGMGGQLFYSTESSRSMGQLILLRKNFPYKVECNIKSNRMLSISIIIDNDIYYVTNVYALNDSQAKINFINNVCKHVKTLKAPNYHILW